MPMLAADIRLYRLILLGLLVWLSSFAAVCVTSGGIAVQRSDRIEIAPGADIEIVGDVATVNIFTFDGRDLTVDSELRNAERINYFVSPQGGTPPTAVIISALINPDLRLRASVVMNIGVPADANVSVLTGIGNITFDGDWTGTIKGVSTNGEIIATGSAGGYHLETVNGVIEAPKVTAPIFAKTRNGSITVAADLPSQGHSQFETRNGDVNLTISPDDDLSLVGQLKVGRIEAPEFTTIDTKKKQLLGVQGKGTASIDIKIKNGTLRLTHPKP
ncbi:MAG: DUF4097 family beta strand repeat protein [Chloroflexi bacterium]|nr:DUF4097 family beta strand repeat protein [Chloroflexota bacterium]